MFYQKNSVEVLNDLDSNLTGLTQEESKLRLEKYGRNALQEKSKTPTWRLFRKFQRPTSYNFTNSSNHTSIFR